MGIEKKRWALVVTLVCLVCVALVAAGNDAAATYNIFGKVTTPSGVPLAGVEVDAGAGGVAVLTDETGRFAVPVGRDIQSYTVRAAKAFYSITPVEAQVWVSHGDTEVNFAAKSVRVWGAIPAAISASSLQKGDLLMCKGDDGLSTAIFLCEAWELLGSSAPYSHAAMYIGDNKVVQMGKASSSSAKWEQITLDKLKSRATKIDAFRKPGTSGATIVAKISAYGNPAKSYATNQIIVLGAVAIKQSWVTIQALALIADLSDGGEEEADLFRASSVRVSGRWL